MNLVDLLLLLHWALVFFCGLLVVQIYGFRRMNSVSVGLIEKNYSDELWLEEAGTRAKAALAINSLKQSKNSISPSLSRDQLEAIIEKNEEKIRSLKSATI